MHPEIEKKLVGLKRLELSKCLPIHIDFNKVFVNDESIQETADRVAALDEYVREKLWGLEGFDEHDYHKFSLRVSPDMCGSMLDVYVYGHYQEDDESFNKRRERLIEKEEDRLSLVREVALRKERKEEEKEMRAKELYINLMHKFEGEDLSDVKDKMIIDLKKKLKKQKKKHVSI